MQTSPVQTSPCHNVMCFEWQVDAAAVIRSAAASGWLHAGIAGGEARAATPVLNDEVRKCDISHGVPPALRDQLAAAVTALGRQSYGFDIQGLSEADPVFVMRYATGDHFAWHVDNGLAGPPLGSRKLSFTLQLSSPDDYDGGDLEFATYSQTYNKELPGPSPVLRQRGNLIVFPSFMLHRVSPVTRGVRHAVVGWVHGPAFR